jgi:membrane protein YdbS with pleckstrin-like domain
MRKSGDQTNALIFTERVSSNKTEALFLALTVLFLLLLIWRFSTVGLDWLAAVFLFFILVFIFYSLNYRTLVIRLTPDALRLTFGIITWTVPMENIQECSLDELPAVMKYGGAGIHFMTIRRRYRASFNFLEYPRVVIAFRRKVGLVWDISFSTNHPDEVIGCIRKAISINRGT